MTSVAHLAEVAAESVAAVRSARLGRMRETTIWLVVEDTCQALRDLAIHLGGDTEAGEMAWAICRSLRPDCRMPATDDDLEAATEWLHGLSCALSEASAA